MEIHINVPFVGYKRTAADSRQRDKMRQWERDLKYACELEMITQDYSVFTSDVSVNIEANFLPSKLAYDIDKILGWVLDSIKRIIIRDDAQVREVYFRITESSTTEHTIIKVIPL